MSFKISLKDRLPDFNLPVKFNLPNGEEAKIEFTVKSLKATEVQEVYANCSDSSGSEFITALASGWNLDDEFNEANQNELVDLYPAVAMALVQAYMEALAGHRVKK